jgi:hypothetical protein
MNVQKSSTEVPVEVSKAALNAFVFLLTVDMAVSSVMLMLNDTAKVVGGIL